MTKWLAHGAVYPSLRLSHSPRRRARARTHEHGRRRHHTQKQITRTPLHMSKKKRNDKRAPTWRKIHPFPSFRILPVRVSCSFFDAPRDVARGGGAQPGSSEVLTRHEATCLRSLSHRWRKIQFGPWFSAPLSCVHPLTQKTDVACEPSAGWRLFMERLEDIVPDHEDPVRQVLSAPPAPWHP